jgi:hypothetical protein
MHEVITEFGIAYYVAMSGGFGKNIRSGGNGWWFGTYAGHLPPGLRELSHP